MYRDIIKKFIDDYSNNHKKNYKASAELCASNCRIIFKQEGIRAIITSRVKENDSLLVEAKQKDKNKKYRMLEMIYDDIKDLAGIRIALYFPEDCKKVEKIIKDIFEVENTKTFPRSSKSRKAIEYKKIFSGYKAKHFFIKHKINNLKKEDKKLLKYNVEIQVASVLMHAWAEVEHDLIYKPLNGNISYEEHQILDEINGLVLSGELALARLQTAVERRLEENKPFNNKYDLHIFLNRYLLNNFPKIKSYNIGRADYLFEFIKLIELNDPDKISSYLENINFEDEIADQIIRQILKDNPKLKNKYIETIKNIKLNNLNFSKNHNKRLNDLVIGWTELQQTLERHAANRDKMLRPYKNNISQIQKQYSNIIDSNVLRQIESISKIRNQISHSFEQLPLKQLNEANKQLGEVMKKINNSLKFIP